MSTYMKCMRHLNVWTVTWCITLNLLFKYISRANMVRAIYVVNVHDALIPQFKGEDMKNAVYSRIFIFCLEHSYIYFDGNHLVLVLSALTFLFEYLFDFQ